jgi:exonuclease III
MRIVTWNCNGALRKKTDVLDQLNADVYVIQECENPAESITSYREWSGNFLWSGESKNKGIGVFAKRDAQVVALNWNRVFRLPGAPKRSISAKWKTSDLKEFLSFRINDSFNAVGVWTKQSKGGTFGYAGQLWKYLQSHRRDILKDECLILGDLNSNVIWDRPDRWWNHSDNLEILDELGLRSMYHESTGANPGDEQHSTFYLHRDLAKPYHIDYIFASNGLRKRAQFKCYDIDPWLTYSDHMPLAVDIVSEY